MGEGEGEIGGNQEGGRHQKPTTNQKGVGPFFVPRIGGEGKGWGRDYGEVMKPERIPFHFPQQNRIIELEEAERRAEMTKSVAEQRLDGLTRDFNTNLKVGCPPAETSGPTSGRSSRAEPGPPRAEAARGAERGSGAAGGGHPRPQGCGRESRTGDGLLPLRSLALSVPSHVPRLNLALPNLLPPARCLSIHFQASPSSIQWLCGHLDPRLPLPPDPEAGFAGHLNMLQAMVSTRRRLHELEQEELAWRKVERDLKVKPSRWKTKSECLPSPTQLLVLGVSASRAVQQLKLGVRFLVED